MDSATVPKPLGTDEEDVAWALATAEAMWARGDRADAVKWIRKAAEAASEADDILRAADLASAAADLANSLDPALSAPPPAAKPLARTMQSAGTPPPVPSKTPPPAPRMEARKPGAFTGAPAATSPTQAAPKTQAMPRVGVAAAKAAAPVAPRAAPLTGARVSEPPRPLTAQPANDSSSRDVERFTPSPSNVPPPAEDWDTTSQPPETSIPETRGPAPTPPEFVDPTLAAVAARGTTPNGSRVGAMRPKINTMTEVDREVPAELGKRTARLQASQAFHVVLWKDARGVHVAPSGTVVSAITVDAILIALDPSADLSAWLSPGNQPGE